MDGVSFVDSIRSMFVAARGSAPLPETMNGLDIHNVPSWGVVDPTGDELIAYVEEARERFARLHSEGRLDLHREERGARREVLARLDGVRFAYETGPEVLRGVVWLRRTPGIPRLVLG